MPGYILNAQTESLHAGSGVTAERYMQKGFIGSIEGGFAFDKNLGLHFAYFGESEHFTDEYAFNGSVYSAANGNVPVNIIELGPEFSWWPSDNNQIFAQINVGHTLSSHSASYSYNYGIVGVYRIRDDNWAYGLAVGYRGYINKLVGLCVQATYHHVNDWPTPSIWAVQLGMAFRF